MRESQLLAHRLIANHILFRSSEDTMSSSTDGGAQTVAIEDRVEALRTALTWQSVGFRKVRISADDRTYSLKDFAGTITIGTKV
jgi:hypothetical protein